MVSYPSLTISFDKFVPDFFSLSFVFLLPEPSFFSSEVGKYGRNQGSCDKCPPGQFQDGKGEKTCKDCPVNTFLPDEGKSSNADCKQCSEGRTTGSIKGSISESKCLCQKEISYYQASDASCKPCPSGADCSLHDGITVAHLFAQPGYWRRSNSTPKFQSCADAYYSNDKVTGTQR